MPAKPDSPGTTRNESAQQFIERLKQTIHNSRSTKGTLDSPPHPGRSSSTSNPNRGINRRYLRVEDLRGLSQLFFRVRRPVVGRFSGQHATPQVGQSVEFRDYRQYSPGDDVGSIDWKLYARSDRLFIKIFEHQSDLTVHLLIDASKSMAYGGYDARLHFIRSSQFATELPNVTKFDYACSLAAGIAFLITKQHDRVGFSIAQNGSKEFLAPRSAMTHVSAILDVMERVQPSGRAQLAETIGRVAARNGRRELLIVFSDFLEDRDETLKALSMINLRGGESIVFHVLHPDELRLPPIQNSTFIDSETGMRLRLNVEDVRPAYDAKLKEFLDGWQRLTKANGIHYSLCATDEPYHSVLKRYLTHRAVRA
jgi:uncharacterized protein (DUF58 family)